jgi:hypothetical protein
VGRFLSQDPIMADHPYVYVRNNPVRFIDPSGLYAICGDNETWGYICFDSTQVGLSPCDIWGNCYIWSPDGILDLNDLFAAFGPLILPEVINAAQSGGVKGVLNYIGSILRNPDVAGTVIQAVIISAAPACLSPLGALCIAAYMGGSEVKITHACDLYRTGKIDEAEAKARIALAAFPVHGADGRLLAPLIPISAEGVCQRF